jgi:hypothetical protein
MGSGEHAGSRCNAMLRQAVTQSAGVSRPRPMVFGVVPQEEDVAVGSGVRIEPKRAGNAGSYLR